MSHNKQGSRVELAQARQELKVAQTRVIELEDRLLIPVGGLSSESYRATFDTMLEGCQIIGFDWRYLYLNDSAARYGRQPKDELIGQVMTERYPGIETTEMFAVLERCMNERISQDAEFEFVYPDGGIAWFEFRIQPVPEGLFILTLDITSRKHAEARRLNLFQALAVLSDINQMIVRVHEPPVVFESACRSVVEKGGFHFAWIGLVDWTTDKLSLTAQAGAADADEQAVQTFLEEAILEQAPAVAVVRTGKRVICNNFELDPRMAQMRDSAARLGCRSLAAFPLMVRGEVQGVLSLYGGLVDFFDLDELQILDEMASDLSFAMEYADQEAHRQQAESIIQDYAQRMAILHQIDLGLLRGQSLQELIEVALRYMLQILPCQQVIVTVADQMSGEAIIFAADDHGEPIPPEEVKRLISPEILTSYDRHHIQVYDDLRSLPALSPTAQQLVSQGWLAALTAPLIDQDHLIGTLGLLADTPNFFTAEHMEIVTETSTQLTIAIRQMHLSEALARHTVDLEQRVIERTAELQAAKDRVEAILNNSLDGILLIHPDLRIQQTNAAFNTLFACAVDDYFDQTILALVRIEDVEAVIGLLQSSFNGQQGQHIEVGARRLDGRLFDAEFSFRHITNGGIVCTIRDITERKVQERQLRYDASIQASISDAVIATDMELRIQSWNHAAETIYGWSADEVIGKTTAEVLQTIYQSEAARQEHLHEFLIKGAWDGEVIQRRKDGSLLHIHASISLFKDKNDQSSGIVSVSRDVTERNRVETALRESEEKFRLLVEAAPMAIVICDEAGQITLVNLQTEALFGYSQGELVGQLVEMLVPDEMRDLHTRHRAAYLDAPQIRPMQTEQEFHLRRKDGTPFLADIELSYIHTEVGLQVISFIMDITERKQIEQAVREQRDFLQLVIDNVPDLILVKDRAGRFELANQVMCEIYGKPLEEMIGKTDADLNPDSEEVASFIQQDEKALTSGQPIFIPEETVIKRSYQTTKIPLLNPAGGYDRLLVVASDITDRKQAEAALRESEEHFRLIVNSVRDYGIYMLDPDGVVASWNLGASQIKGYSTDEIIGQHFSTFYTPEDQQRGEPQRMLEIARSEGHFVGEGWRMRQDGSRFWASIVLTALHNDTGDIIGFSEVTGDLTKRKETEETLQQALIREHELSELKSRFVSMASHEFRTPLATILSMVETLSTYRQKLQDDQIELRLHRIREEIGYLTEVMDDVLQLARLQARRAEFKPTLLDIDALCRSVIDEFFNGQTNPRAYCYTCDLAVSQVYLDRKLIRQIITNLISNAVKYSPPDTQITINLRRVDPNIVLTVEDEGIGIPEPDLKHLFEPFHRAENVGTTPGTGLGLTITKESVELHGGTISVESEVNAGTTFTVTLPISAIGAASHDANSGD